MHTEHSFLTEMTMNDLGGLSVLLIEDEYLIALDAQDILQSLGANRVEIISTFEDAQRRAEEVEFDVVVLDVNLNGKLSFPIANVFMRRGLPVVFASGYQLKERAPPGFEDAISVGKPYSAESLRKAIVTARK